MNERLWSESLAPVEIPELKPNGSITLDLGRIDIHKLVMRQREKEETFEDWQVVCTKGKKVLATAESSKFEELAKGASDKSKKGKKGQGRNEN